MDTFTHSLLLLIAIANTGIKQRQTSALETPRCKLVPNPYPTYPVTETRYFPSLMQCAVFCSNYAASIKYFSFKQQTCTLYTYFPGITGDVQSHPCEASYEMHKFYCFIKTYVNFTSAMNYCNSRGMSGLSIETEEENVFVYKTVFDVYCKGKIFCGPTIWTSGQYDGGLQKWIWRGSGLPVSLSKWSQNKTTLTANWTGLEIGVTVNTSWNAYWLESSYFATLHFICEGNMTRT